MTTDLGILKKLNSELLRRIVIIVEMTGVLLGAIIYNQFPDQFFMFSPLVGVSHLLTLMALPSVFKKMKKGAQEELLHYSGVSETEEGLTDIDLWDRACVGFYILANSMLYLFLVLILFL